MRSILILATIMAQFMLTSVSSAEPETYEDCRSRCAAAKALRDIDCPSPYDSSSVNQERDQCLKTSQETYNACVKSCPPPAPPAESSPAPMSY